MFLRLAALVAKQLKGSRKAAKRKGKPRGKPFPKGQSGNPGGGSSRLRKRMAVADLLEQRFTEDGPDILVDALHAGVLGLDSTSMRLACEYRWGKAVQPVELDFDTMPIDVLASLCREILGGLQDG